MVDSIRGLGNIPAVTAPKKGPEVEDSKKTKEAAKAATDEVKISQDALDLQQAQKAAEDTKQALAKDTDLTLGLKPDFKE